MKLLEGKGPHAGIIAAEGAEKSSRSTEKRRVLRGGVAAWDCGCALCVCGVAAACETWRGEDEDWGAARFSTTYICVFDMGFGGPSKQAVWAVFEKRGRGGRETGTGDSIPDPALLDPTREVFFPV